MGRGGVIVSISLELFYVVFSAFLLFTMGDGDKE